ncbi:MAG TPA: glycosyltransferase family 9 protein [Ktedonobacterales bacterium]|nr:glycosyltransferase family 9 protein [Ktedonobacterales bacterium]
MRCPPPELLPASVSLGRQPRILVVKLATLGDLLLATPLLRALRERYPDAELDVLTTHGSAPLLTESPLVNRVIALDKYRFDSLGSALSQPGPLAPVAGQLLALRRRRYDAVVLAHHLTLPAGRLKYRLLLTALRPRISVGLDNGHGAFLDLRVPDGGFGRSHEVEYGLRLAAALDAPLASEAHAPDARDLGWASAPPERRTLAHPPRIALHPGSGAYSVARRWPVERFAELARQLRDRLNAEVVVVGGPDEDHLTAHLLELLGRPRWATAQTGAATPRGLAELLATCDMLVGNDSFPMHLAVALNMRTVGVFGPTNARAWGPYARHPDQAAYIRRTDLACSPCVYRGHALGTPAGCPERPCLTGLPASAVLRAALRLLDERRAG